MRAGWSLKLEIKTDTKYIVVSGGKGGTGKSLIAVNLAVSFAQLGKKVLLADCDVENPNTYIILGSDINDKTWKTDEIKNFVPKFDTNKCNKCGKCTECYRHAILFFPENYPMLMENLCNGCQVCKRVCPQNAIIDGYKTIGKKYFKRDIYPGLDIIVGELLEGDVLSVKIIDNILEDISSLNSSADNRNENNRNGKKYDIVVLDTAPGAHCDVERVIKVSDLLIGVSEPTPFGKHDLDRIAELSRILNKIPNLILNRADISDYKKSFLEDVQSQNLPILGEIAYSQEILEDYAKGVPFVLDNRDFSGKDNFMDIFNNLMKKLALTEE